MNRRELIELIRKKKSFLCVGLDTDKAKIPSFLLKEEDPLFAFNKAIIDATIDLAVAYKPNLAFYESEGLDAMRSLRKTMQYLQERSTEVFTIADAKRGDIGNTSLRYAKAFLDPEGEFYFDSVTVAPYMGEDSVKPFLSYPNKWVILLALTSNQGAFDFQFIEEKGTGKLLFEKVLEVSKSWGTEENMMYVVGATKAEMLGRVRSIVKDHFLLVPGVGAQGGSLEEVCRYGMTSDCGLLVNASRSILYASSDSNFAGEARKEAYLMQQAMEKQIQERM